VFDFSSAYAVTNSASAAAFRGDIVYLFICHSYLSWLSVAVIYPRISAKLLCKAFVYAKTSVDDAPVLSLLLKEAVRINSR